VKFAAAQSPFVLRPADCPLAEKHVRGSEFVVSLCVVGLKLNGTPTAFNCLYDTTLLVKRGPHLVVGFGANRVDSESASAALQRLVEAPKKPVSSAKTCVERSLLALKSNRFADKGNGHYVLLCLARDHAQ
jgi:hypothetical protein